MPFDDVPISPSTVAIRNSDQDDDELALAYLRSCSVSGGETLYLLVDTTAASGLAEFLSQSECKGKILIIATNTMADKLASLSGCLLHPNLDCIAAFSNRETAYSLAELRGLDSSVNWENSAWLGHLMSIEWGNSVFTILHTPGITVDGICVCDDSEERVFVGDLVSTHVCLLDSADGDIKLYLKSLHLLKLYSSPNCVFSSSAGTYLTIDHLDALLFLVDSIVNGSLLPIGESDGIAYFSSNGLLLEVDHGVLLRAGDESVDEITQMMSSVAH
ncbi:MAG: hypothetical protein SGCHY_005243 [Lobulomycetales sp.]